MYLPCHLSWLVVVFLLFFATPPPADAVIEDVLDIIHVVKEVTVGVLKAWDIVQQSQIAQSIELPLMREKQRKVLKRLKEMSRQIDQAEQKYAENVALAVESVTAFMNSNAPLMAKMNDIHDTMNRISSRFQQMQKYEEYQDKLEASTLITFAEWAVSPNAHSVHHLMDRLHLILLGPEEKENTTANMLSMLAISYELCILNKTDKVARHSAAAHNCFKIKQK
ncbi:uncharacterized protein LOC118732782 isoform X2 [Rhagoletis pomonella]|uniref:uncharacterized protein LOC118732782 isoform X2 n=1 Tax=Rhagoletis pomonella TaxID=28610 RepID=UPI00177F52EA|nr:uncharacterized protein LOC118732782 isoform X2 [Rhagoletis pomonella]